MTNNKSMEQSIDQILLETIFPAFSSTAHIPEAKKATKQLTTLFNETMKALIPEKIAGCSKHHLGNKDCELWYECPSIYAHNKVIEELINQLIGGSSEGATS